MVTVNWHYFGGLDKCRTLLGFGPMQQEVVIDDEIEKSVLGVPVGIHSRFSGIMHRRTRTHTHTHTPKRQKQADEPGASGGRVFLWALQGPGNWFRLMLRLESCDQTMQSLSWTLSLELPFWIRATCDLWHYFFDNVRKWWFIFICSPCTASWQNIEHL